MTPAVTALVLCAAVLHASWNALLKSDEDRLRSITLMSLTSGLLSLPVLLVLPMPAAAAWPALILSAALHLAYNLFLVAAYRYGDLGQVYPIARGASPLLITLAAWGLADEKPDTPMLIGILLVSAGIASLARGWSSSDARKGLPVAVATGVLIAGYSVTDGIGGRLSGDPVSYAAWLFVIDGVPLPVIYRTLRGRSARLIDASRATMRAAVGGAVSLLAYAIVIFAASIAPMGGVSALRETSVVFAALIGRVFLAEPLGAARLASCLAVALGAILLGHAR